MNTPEELICSLDSPGFHPKLIYAFKATLDGKGNIHSHSHTQLMYIYSGSGIYYIDGNSYAVEAGDAIVINPDLEHGNVLCGNDDTFTSVILGFDLCLSDPAMNHFTLPDNNPIIRTTAAFRATLMKETNTILYEHNNRLPGKCAVIDACLTQIVIALYREIYRSEQPLVPYGFEHYDRKHLVSQIQNYLLTHYDEKITLDELAQIMYLSPVYISKIFKEVTGEAPINYLIKIRLEKAKELLTPDNANSIKEIARQVGYEDVYHFSKLFKKYYGTSPLNYKKQA